jgi:hypothetical protein
MKRFIPILVLMTLSLTDIVYAICPAPDSMREVFDLVRAGIRHPKENEAVVKSFLSETTAANREGRLTLRNEMAPGMSRPKRFLMAYSLMKMEPLTHNHKVSASKFRFDSDFEDLLKNIEDPYRANISVQEQKIDQNTSDCNYYLKLGVRDAFLFSFHAIGS